MELQLRPAFDLGPAHALGDDQGLAEWMGVPGRAGARLEPHQGAADAGRRGALELAGDRHLAGEVVSRTLGGFLVGLAHDVHDRCSFLSLNGEGECGECGERQGGGAGLHWDNA
ncbi:hypothetical protein D3C81_1792490 [compost metagenome]